VTLSETHACGLRAGGLAYCWGRNSEGELGSGWVDSVSRTPRAVTGGHHFTSISAGEVLTCGLTAAGKAWCWGMGAGGMLGNGTYGDASCAEGCSSVPVEVASAIPFASIYAGGGTACALASDGTAYCWGFNNYGELGSPPVDCVGWINGTLGHSQCSPVPVAMQTTLKFKSLSLALGYACGLALDGSVHCWGTFLNGEGGAPQLPQLDTVGNYQPRAIASTERFASIASGHRHACALTEAGEAWCWGSGAIGSGVSHPDMCRNGACTRTPARVAGGITFASISSNTHTCGISTAGVTYCWGLGDLSANGDGTRIARNTPTRVLYQRP
jgi:alpha-tubulin suppressor-like RCC1 family protein